MSYSQPTGYRLPSAVSLPALARKLEYLGWPTWRAEVLSTLASVCHDLMLVDDADTVYSRLSFDQVSTKDLPLSAMEGSNLVYQAAEFIDVSHGLMFMPSARPVSPRIDLRCRAQFMDDPDDPDRAWTYVLFGTQRTVLQSAFGDMDGVDFFPMEQQGPDDSEAAARAKLWDRVLKPYARSTPLSVSAPEPQVLFDIADSLLGGIGSDAARADQGKVTMTALVEQCLRYGDLRRDEVLARLTGPAPAP